MHACMPCVLLLLQEKAVFQLDIRQLRLVFEALAERRSVLDNAPHLTSALPILTVSCKEWH